MYFFSEHKYLLYSGWVFSSGNEIGPTVPQSVHQINIVVVGERAFSITNLLKKTSCTSYFKKKSSAFVLFLIWKLILDSFKVSSRIDFSLWLHVIISRNVWYLRVVGFHYRVITEGTIIMPNIHREEENYTLYCFPDPSRLIILLPRMIFTS